MRVPGGCFKGLGALPAQLHPIGHSGTGNYKKLLRKMLRKVILPRLDGRLQGPATPVGRIGAPEARPTGLRKAPKQPVR